MRISAVGLIALLVSAASAQTSTTPVAYVYVATLPVGTSANGQLYEYNVSSAGKLAPIVGSPLATSVNAIALNGKWLFGANYNNTSPGDNPWTANSYSIGSNGALKLVDTANEPATLGQPFDLFLDHTGNTVYAQEYADDIDGYVPFAINQTTGKLTPLSSNFSEAAGSPLTFTSDDKFAYGSSCFRLTPVIYGAERLPSGDLSQLGISPKLPGGTPSTPGSPCVYGAAADPYNDVVIASSIYADSGPNVNQLAVYTYDKSGNLTTTSTYQNMPVSQVDDTVLAMSPKGVYLAGGGSNSGSGGVQLFLMHGAKPLTVLTGNLLPNVQVNQMFWDNYQHLYVLSYTGKLYVFNVTSTGATQAAGSPYSVPNAASLIVLPK